MGCLSRQPQKPQLEISKSNETNYHIIFTQPLRSGRI